MFFAIISVLGDLDLTGIDAINSIRTHTLMKNDLALFIAGTGLLFTDQIQLLLPGIAEHTGLFVRAMIAVIIRTVISTPILIFGLHLAGFI
ncbi:hypothetical protein D3C86_1756290 [compost metagenome]